jgi:putative heme-binding domain-containing protein
LSFLPEPKDPRRSFTVPRPTAALLLTLLLVVPSAAQTPAERLKVLKDFKVELLYSVPKSREGSWVALCVGPKGNLIVSDQSGGLYRVTLPEAGAKGVTVRKIPVDLGEAQGLLWAFDSLYVMVNGRKFESGLYRVRDADGDGELDEVKQLRKMRGGGEHGPHAILPHPDGKSIAVLHGNQTPLTQFDRTRVPPVWGEDHLLPRMPDGKGFMAGVLGPGGAAYRVSPDGKEWELLCVGFRNEYDAAFHRDGDLFAYDADMEWDFNTPWYRPTRVCLAASGAEFGWRNGTGKWPAHYADSLPSVVDIGPGSPTGVCFGYGAKFPAKYQDALFICDWSYGKLYAVHLTPDGSAFRGEAEEFISGSPLPLTDIVVNPRDGALYFTVGGRGTQSGLYRVSYSGKESTSPPKGDVRGAAERATRRSLEALHGRKDASAVETAWPHLDSPDRYLRFAARVAIEHQDPKAWRELALAETKPTAAINALLALVRVSVPDPFHRKPTDPSTDAKLPGEILTSLDRLEWAKLDDGQRLELLRVYQVLFNRLGRPDEAERQRVLKKLDPHFPARDRLLDADLCQVLVYLEAPEMAARTVKLLTEAPTQEEQIEYAKALRMLRTGWTTDLRKQYFSWFLKAGTFKGGASFEAFMRNIKTEAVAALPAAEKDTLKPILDARPEQTAVITAKPRPFVKKWTVDELAPIVEKGLKGRDYDRGRSLFGAANCFACHRFGNEGGANGPDLTGVAGRFSVRDLLESVVEPSKVISDQYQAVIITTTDGKVVTGRIVNIHGDTWHVNTDMLNPGGQVNVNRTKVESMEVSKVSMMPAALLDTFKEDEILDLVAFLLSRGDRKNGMFR